MAGPGCAGRRDRRRRHAALTNTIVEDVQPSARDPFGSPIPDRVLVPPAIILFFAVVAIGVAATIAIAVRMRRLGEPERSQHAWYVAAVATVVIVTWLPVPDIVTFLGNGLSVLALGVAIVWYRLFDIEIVLSRAVVHGLLTAVAVGIYLLAVALLGGTVGSVWPALAAAVAALALGGVRGRLQAAVNRVLYGDRADPFAALARLGQRLEGALAADEILPAIADTARQSLRCSYAAVELAR